MSYENYEKQKKQRIKFGVLADVVVIVLITILSSFSVIPTGYTGVRIAFGQVQDKVVPNGLAFKIPYVQRIERINNKQQQLVIESQVWGETSERTPVYFENTTITYTIKPEYSAWIFANINDYKHSLISEDIVGSALKSASQSFKDAEVTNRDKIERLTAEKLQNSLDDKYKNNIITINKVTISNIDFEDTYNNALVEKQQAQIAYEKQTIENKKAIEKATADAEVAKTKAQAAAEAAVIKAKGVQEANELLKKSLTDDIIRNNAIEKWDGVLPNVMGDSDILIDYTESKGGND